MTGKGRAVVSIGNVVVAAGAVAVIGLRRPVLNIAVVAPLIVCEEAGRAVEVLLNPHAAAHLIDACPQFLGRYLLIELEWRIDGLARSGLADIGLLAILVLGGLVHASLQSHA